MSVRSFLDTNVLVYADDAADRSKQRRALHLFEEHRRSRTGVISLQILQEYFVTLTKKLGLNSAMAREKTDLLTKFDVVILDEIDVLAAIDLHRIHHFSLWDALVIRAAKQGGCKQVLSEDWNHGQQIDGIRLVNPFLS